jgi:mRNA interferase RelE/StbE
VAYQIEYYRTAEKRILSLPKEVQQRVLNQIGRLAENPRPFGSIKLRGSQRYRIRVGDYRIIDAIEDRKLIVLVVDVGYRRDVYD